MFRCLQQPAARRCGGISAAPACSATADQRRSFFATLAAVLLLTVSGSLQAEPFTPASDDIVLATVPLIELAQRDAIARLSRKLDAEPQRADIAVSLARLYGDLHAAVGDPRYLGYAESAVAGFTRSADPEILLVRAHLLQARHEFTAAREMLETIVRSHPSEPRAWLMLAAVTVIQGDYEVSRNACARLFVLGNSFEALTCSAEVASLTGRSRHAYERLDAALDSAGAQSPGLRSWSHLVAAGIARRLGDTGAARRHLQAGLELTPTVFAVTALADQLISDGRPQEALALLQDRPPTTAIVLRRAIVSRQLGRADAGYWSRQAAARMHTLAERGDDRHAREQTLYAIHLSGQREIALAAAKRNWNLQRESIDAELLLQAAIAAGRADGAAAVLQWMRENESDDVRLLSLARKIGARS